MGGGDRDRSTERGKFLLHHPLSEQNEREGRCIFLITPPEAKEPRPGAGPRHPVRTQSGQVRSTGTGINETTDQIMHFLSVENKRLKYGGGRGAQVMFLTLFHFELEKKKKRRGRAPGWLSP